LETSIDEAKADDVGEPPSCATRIVQNNGCNTNNETEGVVELDFRLGVAYAMDIASEDPMPFECRPE
jgi:hypothetical protein